LIPLQSKAPIIQMLITKAAPVAAACCSSRALACPASYRRSASCRLRAYCDWQLRLADSTCKWSDRSTWLAWIELIADRGRCDTPQVDGAELH